jgi:hypothetical protein
MTGLAVVPDMSLQEHFAAVQLIVACKGAVLRVQFFNMMYAEEHGMMATLDMNGQDTHRSSQPLELEQNTRDDSGMDVRHTSPTAAASTVCTSEGLIALLAAGSTSAGCLGDDSPPLCALGASEAINDDEPVSVESHTASFSKYSMSNNLIFVGRADVSEAAEVSASADEPTTGWRSLQPSASTSLCAGPVTSSLQIHANSPSPADVHRCPSGTDSSRQLAESKRSMARMLSSGCSAPLARRPRRLAPRPPADGIHSTSALKHLSRVQMLEGICPRHLPLDREHAHRWTPRTAGHKMAAVDSLANSSFVQETTQLPANTAGAESSLQALVQCAKRKNAVLGQADQTPPAAPRACAVNTNAIQEQPPMVMPTGTVFSSLLQDRPVAEAPAESSGISSFLQQESAPLALPACNPTRVPALPRLMAIPAPPEAAGISSFLQDESDLLVLQQDVCHTSGALRCQPSQSSHSGNGTPSLLQPEEIFASTRAAFPSATILEPRSIGGSENGGSSPGHTSAVTAHQNFVQAVAGKQDVQQPLETVSMSSPHVAFGSKFEAPLRQPPSPCATSAVPSHTQSPLVCPPLAAAQVATSQLQTSAELPLCSPSDTSKADGAPPAVTSASTCNPFTNISDASAAAAQTVYANSSSQWLSAHGPHAWREDTNSGFAHSCTFLLNPELVVEAVKSGIKTPPERLPPVSGAVSMTARPHDGILLATESVRLQEAHADAREALEDALDELYNSKELLAGRYELLPSSSRQHRSQGIVRVCIPKCCIAPDCRQRTLRSVSNKAMHVVCAATLRPLNRALSTRFRYVE